MAADSTVHHPQVLSIRPLYLSEVVYVDPLVERYMAKILPVLSQGVMRGHDQLRRNISIYICISYWICEFAWPLSYLCGSL